MNFEGITFINFEPRTGDTYAFTWVCDGCLNQYGLDDYVDGPEITRDEIDEIIACGVHFCGGVAKHYIYPWTPAENRPAARFPQCED